MGVDLAVMQIDAWASMIYERSSQGFTQAVASTFSGTAPCDKCLQIQEERKQQDENPPLGTQMQEQIKMSLHRLTQLDPAPSAVTSAQFFAALMADARIYLGTEVPPPDFA